MSSYEAVMIPKTVWIEIAETVLNLDPMDVDAVRVGYLQGLVRAQLKEDGAIIKEEK